MPAWLAAVILVAVAMAILNSIPSVMLANSRLLYAFGADHLFPAFVTALHPRHRTPHHALTLTAAAASFSVVGCHVAGSFFLGVDLLLLSMLVNFWLVACSVLALPRVNPALHRRVRFLGSRAAQAAVAGVAVLVLGLLLTVQVGGDLGSAQPWYLKSVTAWLVAMSIGGLVFRRSWRQLAARGIDPRAPFGTLPAE